MNFSFLGWHRCDGSGIVRGLHGAGPRLLLLVADVLEPLTDPEVHHEVEEAADVAEEDGQPHDDHPGKREEGAHAEDDEEHHCAM